MNNIYIQQYITCTHKGVMYKYVTRIVNFRYAEESIAAACNWAYKDVRRGSVLKGLILINSSID